MGLLSERLETREPSSGPARPELVMSDTYAQTVALVRLAVERVAAAPEDEQRYLELNFALDRAVERSLRYRELLTLFEEGALDAPEGASWAWHLAAGLSANLTGDAAIAIRCLESARADLDRSSAAASVAGSFLHGELARAYYHFAEHDSGVEAATRALQLARAANSLLAEAYAHHYLGLINLRRREYAYALRHITAARDLFERMNQRHGRARVLDSLATLNMERGQLRPARQLLEESLTVKEELRDLRGQALTCGNLARLYTALADYEQSLHYTERARELSSRVGDERTATWMRIQAARLHRRNRRPELAVGELEAACWLAREHHDHRLEAYASFALSRAHREAGNAQAAVEAINRAAAYYEHSDEVVIRDRVLLRRALLDGHDLHSAAVQEPLSRLRASEASYEVAEALFETAGFFRNQGRNTEVATLYAEALDAAEPIQAEQLAQIMRDRSDSDEGSAWVDAILTVKAHKDQLEHAYAELRRAETLRDALTQMIVHDLKNPLTAIQPWLQTVQMGVLDRKETDEYLQLSIDECEYMLRMIEDLNDVGRMQHEGKLDLVIEPLDLPGLISEVCRRLEGRARDSGMTIVIEELPELPPVRGDRNKLRRVLENLVGNGIKYGKPPEERGRSAEVRITAYREPPPPDGGRPSVRVEVRDFGVGIPTREAERVFEPYYQAEAGRKRKAGVGLGLAFSRMVVEAHGGTIWTSPNPDGGSIFAFRLPSAES